MATPRARLEGCWMIFTTLQAYARHSFTHQVFLAHACQENASSSGKTIQSPTVVAAAARQLESVQTQRTLTSIGVHQPPTSRDLCLKVEGHM